MWKPGIVFCIALMASTAGKKTIPIVNYNQLQNSLQTSSDTTYVINFFASWCAPCIKEIPTLVNYSNAHAGEKIKLLFVSVDLKKEYEKNLPSIISKNHITQTVYFLDEPTGNWISSVDSSWTGSIPATLIMRKSYKKLIANTITTKILDKYIKKSKHEK